MTFTALEELILEKMSQTKLPGVSIALVDRGEIAYRRGFGFRDVERGLPAHTVRHRERHNGDVELIYERYKFRRTGKLTS